MIADVGALNSPLYQPTDALGYVGYDPTHNQAWYGTERRSGYGQVLKSTPPMMRIDQYPTAPYMGDLNYNGVQVYFNSITEAILAETHGYRGIAPLSLQPLADYPEPYDGLW